MSSQYALFVPSGPELIIAYESFTPDDPARVNPPARCNPQQFSVVYSRGDGSTAGHGFPLTTWIYDWLEPREVNLFRAIVTISGVLQKSRQVRITTRSPEDHTAFATYDCWFHWPEDIHNKRQSSGMYAGVEWRFTRLEEYTG